VEQGPVEDFGRDRLFRHWFFPWRGLVEAARAGWRKGETIGKQLATGLASIQRVAQATYGKI
jgi:hypothetical protein